MSVFPCDKTMTLETISWLNVYTTPSFSTSRAFRVWKERCEKVIGCNCNECRLRARKVELFRRVQHFRRESCKEQKPKHYRVVEYQYLQMVLDSSPEDETIQKSRCQEIDLYDIPCSRGHIRQSYYPLSLCIVNHSDHASAINAQETKKHHSIVPSSLNEMAW